jgi:hypothetical protein
VKYVGATDAETTIYRFLPSLSSAVAHRPDRVDGLRRMTPRLRQLLRVHQADAKPERSSSEERRGGRMKSDTFLDHLPHIL